MPRHSVPGLTWDRKRKVARFDSRTSDGKRHRQAAESYSDYEAAVAAFEAFRAAKEAEVIVGASNGIIARPTGSMTWAEYISRYWHTSVGAQWEDSTRKQNTYVRQRYIDPFFGSRTLDSISKQTITNFKAYLTKPDVEIKRKALGPTTVNFALRRVREVLRNAVNNGALTTAPQIEINKRDEPRLELEMTPAEVEAFLSAFDDSEAFKAHVQRSERARVTDERARMLFSWFSASKPIFVLAMNTGLRIISDLLTLTWSEVDMQDRIITKAQAKTGDKVIISLNDAAYGALQDLRSRAIRNAALVCTSAKTGRQFSETSFRRYFKLAKQIAGITRRLRPHDAGRHTFGSSLVSEGVDIRTVASLLGHRDLASTMRYSRPDTEALRAATKKLDGRRREAK
jgi:integrase